MVGAVARVHGYEPAAITPTTKPILSQKHPDDRAHIAHTLHAIRTTGGAFGSRHRIIDTAGTIRSVVVVGDRILKLFETNMDEVFVVSSIQTARPRRTRSILVS